MWHSPRQDIVREIRSALVLRSSIQVRPPLFAALIFLGLNLGTLTLGCSPTPSPEAEISDARRTAAARRAQLQKQDLERAREAKDRAENPPEESSPPAPDFFVFDVAPKPAHQVAPEYPAEARELELEGRVTMKITVDEFGDVSHATVLQSDDKIFNQPALDAVSQWTFEPARQGGRIVKATIIVPLEFSLNRPRSRRSHR